MMTGQETPLLRVGKAASRLGLNPFTLRCWMKAGKIQAIRAGREARIPLAEVERLRRGTTQHAIVLYGCVSRAKQRRALVTQLELLQSWAAQERPGLELIVLSDIARADSGACCPPTPADPCSGPDYTRGGDDRCPSLDPSWFPVLAGPAHGV
jgi:excisionase family DNA binding protein